MPHESSLQSPEQLSLSQIYHRNPLEWCQKLINQGLSGKHGNPERMVSIIGRGLQLGLDPYTALQTIYVIDGQTAMLTEMMLALCERSGLIEDKHHQYTGEGEKRQCTVWMKRINRTKQPYSFSMTEARQAQIMRPGGGWSKYPDSMLFSRAMSFALRREFPDVLRGIHSVEELTVDKEPVNGNPEPVKESQRQPEGEKVIIETPSPEIKPKRKRRTKAEMAAWRASQSPQNAPGTIETISEGHHSEPEPANPENPPPPVSDPVEEMSFVDAEKLIDQAIPAKSTPHNELRGRAYQSDVSLKDVLMAAKLLRKAFDETDVDQIPEDNVKVLLAHWPAVLATISREKAKAARNQHAPIQ